MLTLDAHKTRQKPQFTGRKSQVADTQVPASEIIPTETARELHTRPRPKRSTSLLGDALTKISQMSPPPLPKNSGRAGQGMTSRDRIAQPAEQAVRTPESPTQPAQPQSNELAAEDNASDRRGLPRRMGRSATRVLIATTAGSSGSTGQFHGAARTAQLADLCMTGAALITVVPYTIGSQVRVRFESPDLDAPCDRSGKVVRLLQLGHDRWKVVCQLDQQLDHSQLASLSMHVFESNLI